jgi:hypothetical protein
MPVRAIKIDQNTHTGSDITRYRMLLTLIVRAVDNHNTIIIIELGISKRAHLEILPK